MSSNPLGRARTIAMLAAMAPSAIWAGASEDAPGSWKRPHTTRRYLHPPMAECMFTLWNDGKVMRGENLHRHDWLVDSWKAADVLWVLHGGDDRPFDFKTAENRQPQDGTPFHGLTWRQEGLSVAMDAFCETGVRNPAVFLRLTFAAEGDGEVREQISVHLRRMPENLAVKGAPDIYEPYETQTGPFLVTSPSGYIPIGTGAWQSEAVAVRAEGLPADATWDGGAVRFTVSPGKEAPLVVTFTMAARDSVVRPGDWESELARSQSFWQGELAKLNRLPPPIAQNPESLRLVQNLTVQMLQCFCHPVGSDLTLPRQGGLQRYVWPWDCKYMLAALGLIGDFGDYVEGALDFYFREYATDEGLVGPFRNNWICNTGECIHSLARYCLDTDNRAVWERHRDAAMRAFDWIRRTRATPPAGGGLPGLFPIGGATDNATPVQLWCFTDMLTLESLSVFATAARHFGEPRAAEVEAERDNLRDVLARIYGRFSAAAKDSDELRIPLTPDGDDEALRKAGYFDTQQGYALNVALRNGFAPAGDVMKVYAWHLRNGKADPHGLCANHPPLKNLADRHVWYTTASEMYWHDTFLRVGRRDLADLVWEAVLKYAMSPEFYVSERYRDDTPWYSPWCPNASGSGRIILMLLSRLRPTTAREDDIMPMEPGRDRYKADDAVVVHTNRMLTISHSEQKCRLIYDWLPGMPRKRGFDDVVLRLDRAVPGGSVTLRLREENTTRWGTEWGIYDFRIPWTEEVRFPVQADYDSLCYFVSLTFEFPPEAERRDFSILGMSGTHRVSPAEAFSLDVDTGDPLHVMAPGGTAVVVIRNLADEPLRLGGSIKIRDFHKHGPDISVDEEIAAGGTARIPIALPDRTGIWRMTGEFSSGDSTNTTPTVSFAVLEPREITPQYPKGEFRLGVVCHLDKYSEKYRELCGRAMAAVGVKLVRCDLFSPGKICPAEGTFNWEDSEACLLEMERLGISTQAIIYDCPEWACWKTEPHDHKFYCAMRPGVFESYCRTLAARYGTRIAYYEIGNEWDMAPADWLPDDQAIAMQWEGMRGLHAGCPDAVCVANGWASDPYFESRRRTGLHRRMIGENKDSYDIYAIHGHGFYEGYADGIRRALQFLKDKDVKKPWFSDETALSSSRGREDESARTVWKKIVFAWSHGSIDYIWYNLRGTGFNPNHEEHGYGLFTADFYPRASAASFSALSGLLGHLRFVELLSDDTRRLIGKWAGLRHGVPVEVYVGWDLGTKNPAPVVIDVGTNRAQRCDIMGNFSPVNAKDGKVAWALSAEPSALVVEKR